MATIIRAATPDSVDPEDLAAVAAQTFPLACPPTVNPENIAAFVAANLSAARFGEYLNDPDRALFTAEADRRIVGYAMLVRGVGDDDDVRRAVTLRPAAELSKMYVLPDYHGSGVGASLMDRRTLGRSLRLAGCRTEKPTRATFLCQMRVRDRRGQDVSGGHPPRKRLHHGA